MAIITKKNAQELIDADYKVLDRVFTGEYDKAALKFVKFIIERLEAAEQLKDSLPEDVPSPEQQ